MAQTTADGVAGVLALVGRPLGRSAWVVVGREQVDRYARATSIGATSIGVTGTGATGAAEAPGLLVLSLLPSLLPGIVAISGFRLGVNYGTAQVRFPAPVPVGARVRASVVLSAATPVAGGVQLDLAVTMEREGSDIPAVVATVVYRRYL